MRSYAVMPTITGHKDSEATACPGTSLYPYVTGTLRTNTTNRLAKFNPVSITLTRSTAPASSRASGAPACGRRGWPG